MAAIRFLEADNDFNAGITLTDEDGDPVTGLTITAFISATRNQTTATAINPDLSTTLTEDPALSGIYTGVIQGSAITERLCNASPTSYTNQRVYLMRKSGQDYHKPVPCRVRDGSIY
jgi:hypothetical protein